MALYCWSQNVCRLDNSSLPTSPTLACWPGGCKERGSLADVSTTPWQLLGWRLGLKYCCCGWLLLDQQPPAHQLASSRMLCSVAVYGHGVTLRAVPDLHRKKGGNQGLKEVAMHHCFPPGLLARLERHRRRTYCSCGTQLLLDSC